MTRLEQVRKEMTAARSANLDRVYAHQEPGEQRRLPVLQPYVPEPAAPHGHSAPGLESSGGGAVISDLFQPPHDTVDDVEPLCSACGGDCDSGCSGSGGRSFHPPTPSSNTAPAGDGQKRAFFGAGNSATAPASHSGSGFPHPGNGALSTRCECGDADCFMEGP